MLALTKHDVQTHGEALSDLGVCPQDDEHLDMFRRFVRTFGSPKEQARLSAFIDGEYRNERR